MGLGRNNQGMEVELDMAIDVNALTRDMARFATLLRLVRLPELAENYEDVTRKLRTDSSTSSVEEVREWVSKTLAYSGSGSIYDRYIQKQDGSIDRIANAEYKDILEKLTAFASGD